MSGDFRARRVDASPGRILRLAVPMMLAHMTEPLLGLVDTAVIGRLGEASLLGAVAIGAVLFEMLFWGLGSLRMSTAALTAQAHGAGNDRETVLALSRALLVAAVLGLVIIALQAPIMAATTALMQPSPAVQAALGLYVGVRIWSAPFALTNYAVLGSLIGRGRTDLGLALQVAINLAKIALTLLLVPGLGLGVAGAATATLLAEILGAGAGLLLLRRLGALQWGGSADVLKPAAMRRMLAVNRDVAIRSLTLLAAFAFFTAQGSRAGDVTLAANALLNNLFLLGAYFLDGYATAAEQLCGQALGARDEAGFRRTVRNALALSVVTGLAVTALVFGAGAVFVDFVVADPAVRDMAHGFLPYAALTPLVGATAFAFDGIYVGATWTRAMRDLMLAAFALYMAAFWLAGDLGNTGLWVALLVFLGARGLGQAALYPRLARRTFAQPAGPAVLA